MKTSMLIAAFIVVAPLVGWADRLKVMPMAEGPSARLIEFAEGEPIKGRLVYYRAAIVMIEKEDGTTEEVRAYALSDSEIQTQFPEVLEARMNQTLALLKNTADHAKSILEPIIQDLDSETVAENKALKQALEATAGKDHAELIREANAANIRAAKAEGRVLQLERQVAKLEKKVAADPFAPAARAPARSVTVEPKTWHTVQILQGSGNKRSPRFTVTGEWRAHWQFTSGEYGYFGAVIEGDSPSDYQLLANTTKSGRDVTMGKGRGSLTLDVSSLVGNWAVKIEELR